MKDATKSRKISKSELIGYQLAESDAGEQVSKLREYYSETSNMREWLALRKESENNAR